MIERITYEIANITTVEPKTRDSILAEFVEMTLQRSADCVHTLLFDGIEAAMNSCNPKPAEK